MQTLSIPFTTSAQDRAILSEWQRRHACVVRSSYALAGVVGPDGALTLRPEKELRARLKARFPDHPLGSWAIHCATREGLWLRSQRPDGRMVFGGRDHLERRRKGLIDHAAWQARRHTRAIEIVGDRTRWGNRHLALSANGKEARITFLGTTIVLQLSHLPGKRGRLVRALAALAQACEVGLTFSLGARSLSITFDPMDLRRLPAGMTLEGVQRAAREAKGHKPRGRPRKNPDTHYAAARVRPLPAAERPVHPEWRDPVPLLARRCVAIDLNPTSIGCSVVEVAAGKDARDLGAVRVLHHALIRLDIPITDSRESTTALMAALARHIVSLARAWNCGSIVHEHGLGKLRWSKRSKRSKTATQATPGVPEAQSINHWVRNALLQGLARRARLAGIPCRALWGGYSTTIGNLAFALPDAAAAAAEMARRGLVAQQDTEIKDRLPAVPPAAQRRRWKDDASGRGGPPPTMAQERAWQAIAEAGTWQVIHREIKAARIGVRRLHPGRVCLSPQVPQAPNGIDARYAVRSLGQRPGRGTLYVPHSPSAAGPDRKDPGPGVSTLQSE